MTLRQRAEEALKRAATPRPWKALRQRVIGEPGEYFADVVAEPEGDQNPETGLTHLCVMDRVEDAEFIAEARADVPDFAAALLRLTGPEMREQIFMRIQETRDCDAPDCGDCAEMTDAIMALLLAEVQ
mgnify:CR=1 FL=1